MESQLIKEIRCKNSKCASTFLCETEDDYYRNLGKFCSHECGASARLAHRSRILSKHNVGKMALSKGWSKKETFKWIDEYEKSRQRPRWTPEIIKPLID